MCGSMRCFHSLCCFSAARILVSPPGDFDLFVGARQCTQMLSGGVTARSHYCWYDMSHGSRTRAHRWGSVWFATCQPVAQLAQSVLFPFSAAFHVKESWEMKNDGPPPRPDATEPQATCDPGTESGPERSRRARHEKIMVRLWHDLTSNHCARIYHYLPIYGSQ